MTLNDFINKYRGKGIDFDGYYGDQCVDLINQYCVEVLDTKNPMRVLPGASAIEIYNNYNGSEFEKIANTPDNVPQPGDIVFWNANSAVTGPAGHTAIFISGDQNKFTSLDQNYPTGTLTHEQTHDYTGVVGWLRLKQALQSNYYRGYDLTNKDSMKIAIDILIRVQAGELVEKSQLDNANQAISELNAKVGELQNENAGLKKNIAEVQNSNANLASEMQKMQQADSTAIDAGLKAEGALKEAQSSLNTIYKALALPPNASLSQVLSAIDTLRVPHDRAVKQYERLYDLVFTDFIYKRAPKTKPLVQRFLRFLGGLRL